MYTETAYGQFPIWHPDAEIRMMDLENRTAMDMSALNSPDTDSYHSWSSNSDWVVFSSRRDNGLYTLPYICYIGKTVSLRNRSYCLKKIRISMTISCIPTIFRN